jgi:hypothetical protein
MTAARRERLHRDAPAACRPAAAVLPGLAGELRGLADQLDVLEPGRVIGELAPHQHEPGILRDTVRCPACAATVPVSQRKLDTLAEVLGEVRP